MQNLVYHGDTFVERRRFTRVPVNIKVLFKMVSGYAAGLLKPKGAEQTTQGSNFSDQGMAMRSGHRLEPGQMLDLELYIPNEKKRLSNRVMQQCTLLECRKVVVRANVIWCLPFTGGNYVSGLEFSLIASDDHAFLQAFLQEFRLPEHNPGL